MTVYGPYTRDDGRKHVIHYVDGVRRTQSYPRFLMEKHLGRKLDPDDHVDHINNDYTDDRIENLQLLTQTENNKKSVKATGRSAKWYTFLCPECDEEAMIPYKDYKRNQLIKKKAGPYCSKSCAGKASHKK
jgi:hypothetical protein